MEQIRGQAVRVGVDLCQAYCSRCIRSMPLDACSSAAPWRTTGSSPGALNCPRLHRRDGTTLERAPLGAQARRARPGRAHHRPQLIAPYRRQAPAAKERRQRCRGDLRGGVALNALRPRQEHRAAEHAVRAPPREGLKAERTACINPHPRPAGRVRTRGPAKPAALASVLADVARRRRQQMNALAAGAAAGATLRGQRSTAIAWCDERIAAHERTNRRSRRQPRCWGSLSPPRRWWQKRRRLQSNSATARAVRCVVGPGSSTALQRRQEQPRGHHQTRRHLPAHAADPGRQVGGDDGPPAQRPDLAVGGGAARQVRLAKAVVALANKNARILWAVMTQGEAFDARHVGVKPGVQAVAAPAG